MAVPHGNDSSYDGSGMYRFESYYCHYLFINQKSYIMNILNRKLNLNIETNSVIGIAIGTSSYTTVDSTRKAVKKRTYMLHILCFTIELCTKRLLKREENKIVYPKKRLTKIGKLIGALTLLSLFASVLAIYEAVVLNSSGLLMSSTVFIALFIFLGISYLAMDPKEKYKHV